MVAMSATPIPSIEEASNLSRAERNRLSAMRSRERNKLEIKNLEGRVCVAIERKKQLATSVLSLKEECDRIEEQLKKSLVRQNTSQPQQNTTQPQRQLPQPQQQQSQNSAFEDWMLSTDNTHGTDSDFVDFDFGNLPEIDVKTIDLNQECASTTSASASASSTTTTTNTTTTNNTAATLPPPPPHFDASTMLDMLDMTDADVVMDPAITPETIASLLPDLF